MQSKQDIFKKHHEKNTPLSERETMSHGEYVAILYAMEEYASQFQSPAPSKDVKAAADEYAEQHAFRVPYDGSNSFYDGKDFDASKEGFIAGAKWAEQAK